MQNVFFGSPRRRDELLIIGSCLDLVDEITIKKKTHTHTHSHSFPIPLLLLSYNDCIYCGLRWITLTFWIDRQVQYLHSQSSCDHCGRCNDTFSFPSESKCPFKHHHHICYVDFSSEQKKSINFILAFIFLQLHQSLFQRLLNPFQNSSFHQFFFSCIYKTYFTGIFVKMNLGPCVSTRYVSVYLYMIYKDIFCSDPSNLVIKHWQNMYWRQDILQLHD